MLVYAHDMTDVLLQHWQHQSSQCVNFMSPEIGRRPTRPESQQHNQTRYLLSCCCDSDFAHLSSRFYFVRYGSQHWSSCSFMQFLHVQAAYKESCQEVCLVQGLRLSTNNADPCLLSLHGCCHSLCTRHTNNYHNYHHHVADAQPVGILLLHVVSFLACM